MPTMKRLGIVRIIIEHRATIITMLQEIKVKTFEVNEKRNPQKIYTNYKKKRKWKFWK